LTGGLSSFDAQGVFSAFTGTGGVSMTVLILAKAFGCTVIVTSSSDDKLKLVKERYGADLCINYKTHSKWGEEARRLTGGVGVDVVIENGGAGTIEQSFEAIKMGGLITVIGFLADPEGKHADVAGLALSKGAIVRGITVGSKQYLEELVRFVCARELKIPVDKVFEFEYALEAYKYLQGGSHVGKVCIEV
jgi:NADPH:quinone reductase-like Zn-dependent oxidoreductase